MDAKKFSKWVAGISYHPVRGDDQYGNAVYFIFPKWRKSDDKKLAKCTNIIDTFDKDSGKFVVVGWDFAKSLDLDPLDNDGDHPLNSKDLDTFYKFVGPIN